MGISKLSYGSGENLFEISYKNDETIATSGTSSYMSDNFKTNSFAAFQRKELTQYFSAGADITYNNATNENLFFKKFSNVSKTSANLGETKSNGLYTFNSILVNADNDLRIVTDMTDIQRVVWRAPVGTSTVTVPVDGVSKTYTYYTINTSYNEAVCDILSKTNPTQYIATNVPIKPWLIDTGNTRELTAHFARGDRLDAWNNQALRNAGTRINDINNVRYYPLSTDLINYDFPAGNNQSYGFLSDDKEYLFVVSMSTLNFAYASVSCYILTENALKNFLASSGFKFLYNNVLHKPVAKNGVITGYTNDLTSSSDWDKWHTRTDHTIPDVPPAGGDINDHETNMPLAYIGGTAGMITFYEINKNGLASADDISDAISRFDISQIGKDLLRNFISFKAFAAINTSDTVDRQIKIAGIPLEDSGGNELTGRVIGGVKPIDLFPTSGGVTIPTLYNDYRDYEPYTRIQMYVPFCGWFNLPSWCIGKKITGTMFTDLYNGTVKAVIKASETVVAEVGGCCAYDIPFVADATGAKASAVISSALTTAAAVGATVAMPNVATGIAAVSSAANLAATLNCNDTTLKGVLGDGSNLNGLLHVYIKVSRPKSPNGTTNIPDSYKHEIGIPTMKEVTISAGDGFIQVMDAKVNGTMTAREKQMIIEGFRHGLNF